MTAASCAMRAEAARALSGADARGRAGPGPAAARAACSGGPAGPGAFVRPSSAAGPGAGRAVPLLLAATRRQQRAARRATGVVAVYTESREPGVGAGSDDAAGLASGSSAPPRVSMVSIMPPVADDMSRLDMSLRNIVGERHPMLMAAAEQIFGAGGKRIRPMLVFLVARATAQLGGLADLAPEHRRLAEITEMIHTASLVHDDVLDDCNLRRGADTVNSLYGTRVAVLAGDFLFAQSSWFLANLNNLEVIKLISQVIADFANGEIKQATSLFDCETTFQDYLDKSFYKTASLIAASCRSAAVFSNVSEEVKADMFEYGRHLGLAFQVVDDILDFTQSTEQLGKPQGQDLASGNLTAPALFALEHAAVGPQLRALIESEFTEEGSLGTALELVVAGGGVERSLALARREGELARAALGRLPAGEVKKSLEGMIDYVLERLY